MKKIIMLCLLMTAIGLSQSFYTSTNRGTEIDSSVDGTFGTKNLTASNGIFNSLWANNLSSGVFFGIYSTASSNSAAFGYQALQYNTQIQSTALGYQVGRSNTGIKFTGGGFTTGMENTGSSFSGFGYDNGRYNTGDYVSLLGAYSGWRQNGDLSVGMGYLSLENNNADETVGIGSNVLQYNGGAYNTAVGGNAFNTFTADPTQTTIETSSFTAGLDDYVANAGTWAGNIDGIWGQDNVLRGYGHVAARFYKAGSGFDVTAGFEIGHKYQITFDYYCTDINNAGQGILLTEWDLGLTDQGFTTFVAFPLTSPQMLEDQWVSLDTSFTFNFTGASEGAGLRVQTAMQSVTDTTYIKNIKIYELNDLFFNYTNIDSVNNKIYLNSHGYTGYVNLKYTQGTSAITGLTDGLIFNFKVDDADTLELIYPTFTTRGTGTGHKLTASTERSYTNSTAIGNNAEPTASNQIVLGNTSVTTLITNAAINYAADVSTTDTYAITLPQIGSYVAGLTITFKAVTANTDGATLKINSLSSIAILKKHDTALATGDIEAGQIVVVVYDGTNFQMTSQLAQ